MVTKLYITVHQWRRDYQEAIGNRKCSEADADPERSQLLIHEVKKVKLELHDVDHTQYFEDGGKALGPNLLTISYMYV
jgi:hypothetical protein